MAKQIDFATGRGNTMTGHPRKVHSLIKWSFSKEGQFKLNSDGASKVNLGEGGCGRGNHQGCYKFQDHWLWSSCILAFVLQSNFGVSFTVVAAGNKSIHCLIVESDSSTIITIFMKGHKNASRNKFFHRIFSWMDRDWAIRYLILFAKELFVQTG